MSLGTETGIGFTGVAVVEAVDVVNGYVLTRLKPWTVYQPGLDQYLTTSNHQTYTNAEFDTLETGLSRTAASILRGLYDSQRGIWTLPIPVSKG